jgi:hypothetical protein
MCCASRTKSKNASPPDQGFARRKARSSRLDPAVNGGVFVFGGSGTGFLVNCRRNGIPLFRHLTAEFALKYLESRVFSDKLIQLPRGGADEALLLFIPGDGLQLLADRGGIGSTRRRSGLNATDYLGTML